MKSYVKQKETEYLRYKSLRIGIQRLWNMKGTVMSVINGAIGIVTKVSKKNLEAIPGKRSIVSLQKAAVLGTSQLIPKVLQSGT